MLNGFNDEHRTACLCYFVVHSGCLFVYCFSDHQVQIVGAGLRCMPVSMSVYRCLMFY